MNKSIVSLNLKSKIQYSVKYIVIERWVTAQLFLFVVFWSESNVREGSVWKKVIELSTTYVILMIERESEQNRKPGLYGWCDPISQTQSTFRAHILQKLCFLVIPEDINIDKIGKRLRFAMDKQWTRLMCSTFINCYFNTSQGCDRFSNRLHSF